MSKSSDISPSVSLAYLRVLMNYCKSQGFSEIDLCNAAGVDPELLKNIEERIPREDSLKIFRASSKLLNDPDIGLHAGQAMQPGFFGVLGLSLISAKNAEQALELGLKYQSLVADGLNITKEIVDDEVRIIIPTGADGAEFTKEGIDTFLSSLLSLTRTGFGADFKPSWLSFKMPEPKYLGTYKSLFDCPLLFDQQNTIVAFPKSYLQVDLLQSNPEVVAAMKPLMEQQLTSFKGSGEADWLISCRDFIAKHLCYGPVSKDALAEHLSLSTRQLRRQLEGEKLNITTLIEDTRSELALKYIRELDKSLLDITYLLGYKEQASFQKAFKQWTGFTPGSYRQLKEQKSELEQ